MKLKLFFSKFSIRNWCTHLCFIPLFFLPPTRVQDCGFFYTSNFIFSHIYFFLFRDLQNKRIGGKTCFDGSLVIRGLTDMIFALSFSISCLTQLKHRWYWTVWHWIKCSLLPSDLFLSALFCNDSLWVASFKRTTFENVFKLLLCTTQGKDLFLFYRFFGLTLEYNICLLIYSLFIYLMLKWKFTSIKRTCINNE